MFNPTGMHGNGGDSISVFFLFTPPSLSEMVLSLPWEQECKTSALLTKEHLEATGKAARRPGLCLHSFQRRLPVPKRHFLHF